MCGFNDSRSARREQHIFVTLLLALLDGNGNGNGNEYIEVNTIHKVNAQKSIEGPSGHEQLFPSVWIALVAMIEKISSPFLEFLLGRLRVPSFRRG